MLRITEGQTSGKRTAECRDDHENDAPSRQSSEDVIMRHRHEHEASAGHRSDASGKGWPKAVCAASLRGTVTLRWSAGRGARRASRESRRSAHRHRYLADNNARTGPRAKTQKATVGRSMVFDIGDRALTFKVTGAPRRWSRTRSHVPARPVDRKVRRHFGADGTSPYRVITATKAALFGGPSTFTTSATSLKYWAPMSGDRTIRARAMLLNGLENA
jgi:hypothetical protein